MGLFDWLFGRKRPREPQVPQDLWNPEGMDRLSHEELHQAIEAAAADPTPENRRRVFQILLTIVYCVPLAGESEGNRRTFLATENEAGERVLMAFTDPFALRRWVSNPPAFMAMTAAKLFELVLNNGFVQVLINPAGPAGGQLSQEEVERLARGEIPVE